LLMSKFKYKLAIVFAALFLVGGGVFAYFRYFAPLTPEEPVKLEIWYADTSVCGNLPELVKSFNKNEGWYRQVSAETRCFNNEEALLQAAKGAVSTGELPDVIICDTHTASYLQGEGKLADAEQFITDIRDAGYDNRLLKACTYKGALRSIPLLYETDMLIINRELYGDAKAIDSFEELCTVANSYYMENREPFFTVTDYSSFFCSAMTQLGETFTAENPFDSDNEDLRYIYDLLATAAFKRGYAATTGNPALLVAKGELPCAIVSSTQIMQAEESIDTEQIELVPVPAMENGDRVYTRNVIGVSILKSDENTEKGAAIFAKWLSSEEIYPKLAGDSGFATALTPENAEETRKSACRKAVLAVMTAMDYRDFCPSSDYAANSREFNDIIDNIMKKSLS